MSIATTVSPLPCAGVTRSTALSKRVVISGRRLGSETLVFERRRFTRLSPVRDMSYCTGRVVPMITADFPSGSSANSTRFTQAGPLAAAVGVGAGLDAACRLGRGATAAASPTRMINPSSTGSAE